MKEFVINSVDELPKVAQAILDNLEGRNVVALFAPMGAGKTTLTTVILELLGSKDIVTSPTFALVNQYRTAAQKSVYHFDFYRINNLSEVFDMGYEEYFYSDDLCLVEWPEKVEALLPDDTMVVSIEILDETSRKVVIR